MAGTSKIQIQEDETTLKALLRADNDLFRKERLLVLYLLKSKKAKTVLEAAEIVGRNRVTVQEWLFNYREYGLEGLLSHKPKSGRPSTIPEWAAKEVVNKLTKEKREVAPDPKYTEYKQALEEILGTPMHYKTVYKTIKNFHIARKRLEE